MSKILADVMKKHTKDSELAFSELVEHVKWLEKQLNDVINVLSLLQYYYFVIAS